MLFNMEIVEHVEDIPMFINQVRNFKKQWCNVYCYLKPNIKILYNA